MYGYCRASSQSCIAVCDQIPRDWRSCQASLNGDILIGLSFRHNAEEALENRACCQAKQSFFSGLCAGSSKVRKKELLSRST